jgi:hypothetical protein
MAAGGRTDGGAPVRALLMTAVGWLGLAACLTLVFLAMRAVMDVGGACADGGPYVSAQACPEGSTPALLLGIFLGMGFGFLASIGGIGLGGVWAATPVLAWSALFGSLGWNFMDYGLFNAPPEIGIDLGFVIPGVMFWIMAAVPLLGIFPVMGLIRASTAGPSPAPPRPDATVTLPGPGQPARPASRLRTSTHIGPSEPQARSATGPASAELDQLAGIATDFGAVIGSAMGGVPADPAARPEAGGQSPWPAGPDGTLSAAGLAFTEGTQALLDRLERLADMRDRGLLAADEYETAKAAIMAELEERT